MFEAPPDGLVYTPTHTGHAWTLPARTGLGTWRLLGLIPIAACLIMPGIVGGVGYGILNGFFPSDWPSWAAPAAAWALALLIFCCEWKIWRLGLAVLCGRSEVRIEGSELVSVERLPFVSWTWRTEAARVEEVRLAGGSDASDPEATGNRLTKLYGITLIVNGNKRPLVIGYPLSLLEPLAAEVTHHVERIRGEDVPLTLRPGSLESDEKGEDHDPFGRGPEDLPSTPIQQPDDSDAVVTEQNGELSVMLPPAGLKKGSKGLWGFSVIWNTVIGLIVAGWIVAIITGNNNTMGGVDYLIVFGLLSVFVGIGVWTGVHAWSMGKRHIAIDVIGDAVVFTIASPYSTKQFTYTRDELVSIRVGPSGTEVNDTPVLELQVRHRLPDATSPDDVAKRGLLSSRPNDELRWLASLLTARLGMAPDAPSGHQRKVIRIRLGGQKAG